jgi:hypothetical protein
MNAPERDPPGFERRLASWLPAASALDRDRMLFEAGRAFDRAKSRGKVWTSVAVSLALLLVGLGGLFAHERSRRLALEAVLVTRPPVQAPELTSTPPRVALPVPGGERLGPSSYFVLTMRLAAGELDFPPVSLEYDAERPPRRTGSQPPTLRPRDFERVLDL